MAPRSGANIGARKRSLAVIQSIDDWTPTLRGGEAPPAHLLPGAQRHHGVDAEGIAFRNGPLLLLERNRAGIPPQSVEARPEMTPEPLALAPRAARLQAPRLAPHPPLRPLP